MAQENQIDIRLPYRIGYPKLPALPVQSISPTGSWHHYIPNLGHYQRNIGRILGKNGVLLQNFRLEHRFNEGHEYNENLPTIVLIAYFQQPLQPSSSQDSIYDNGWIQAVIEIRESLIEADIHNPVELIDVDAFYDRLWPSPILSSDRDIIQECNVIMPDILQIIRKQDWVSVDVFHLDSPSVSQRPTLIISARDANKDIWWDTILPELRTKTKTLDVVLRFLHNLSFQVSDTSIHTLVNESCYSLSMDTVFMGDSIGLRGSEHSGSFGGKIRLKDKSRELDLGLTNCHVLHGNYLGNDPSKIDSHRTIVSISDEDHERVLTHLTNAIRESTKNLKETNEKLTLYEKGSTKYQNMIEARLIWESELQALRVKMGIFQKFSRDIGTVYAESDFRIRDNPRIADASQDLEGSEGMSWSQRWLLDWGLIQMEPSKAISSKLPEIRCNENTKNTQETYLTTGFEVTEYASISPNQNLHVMKRGRTSGWSQGIISAVKSIYRHEQIQDSELNIPTIVRDNIACYSIVVRHNKERELFLNAGDSGSLILLNEQSKPGVIVGLGFASNLSTLASYMVPMDLVLDDIKESTGMEVLEPIYCGTVPEVQR